MDARRTKRFLAVASSTLVVALGLGAVVALGEPAEQAAAPEPDAHGVISAHSWAEIYPNEYNTYLQNSYNVPPEYDVFIAEGGVDETSVGVELLDGDFSAAAEKADYLADDQAPEIKTLGKGYGYAKYYTEPAGHTYSLWSIAHNGRLGPLEESGGKISCFTCKTPQIHYDAAAWEGEGSFWTQPIKEHAYDYDENISCANCHVNDDPTQLSVLRADWQRAMGDDAETVPLQGQVCGQCHCDYSMAPAEPIEGAPFDAGEPTSPYYGGLESMTPESALAFYDEYGFCDWTYASTGAKMLAIRHAEFEFCYANGGNKMVAMGYNCNDCHMGVATDEEGNEFTNHCWASPLDNPALLESCDKCHANMYEGGLAAWVADTQADIDGRTHQLGLRAEQFILNFQDVVAIEGEDGALVFDMDTALANGLTEDEVAELQQIQREACYYWNLAAAENSEGVHNPGFYEELLAQGNALLDRADEILGVSSVVEM